MKKYLLRIIIQKKFRDSVLKVAESLSEILDASKIISVEKYPKLENSFQIEITGCLNEEINSVYQSIELTNRICSPWSCRFKSDDQEVELIFDKSDFVRYSNVIFNTIVWASFEIIEL